MMAFSPWFSLIGLVAWLTPLAWVFVGALILRKDRRYYSWMILLGAVGKLLASILSLALMVTDTTMSAFGVLSICSGLCNLLMIFGFVLFALVFHRRGGFGDPIA